jgi:hypothetical protein
MNLELHYIPTPFENDGLWYPRISKQVAGNNYAVKYMPYGVKSMAKALFISITMAWERTLIQKYDFSLIDECPLDVELEFAFLDQSLVPIVRKGVLKVIETHRFIECDGTRWHLDVHPLVMFKHLEPHDAN